MNLNALKALLSLAVFISFIFCNPNVSATTDIVDIPKDSIAPDKTGIRELTSIELAKEMKIGWNVGNSLEAIGGETAWGNPRITQRLIDSVKAAGFNAVRIPVAWSQFSNES